MAAELIGIARADLARRAVVIDRLACFRPPPGRYVAVMQAHQSLEAVWAGEPAGHAVALARTALAGDQLTPEKAAIWVALHTLLMTDHLDEVEARLHQALDTAIERDLLIPIAVIRGYLSRAALLRGDLTQASEHVDRGAEAASELNFALPLLHSTSAAP